MAEVTEIGFESDSGTLYWAKLVSVGPGSSVWLLSGGEEHMIEVSSSHCLYTASVWRGDGWKRVVDTESDVSAILGAAAVLYMDHGMTLCEPDAPDSVSKEQSE